MIDVLTFFGNHFNEIAITIMAIVIVVIAMKENRLKELAAGCYDCLENE